MSLFDSLDGKEQVILVPSHRLKWDVYFRYASFCQSKGKEPKPYTSCAIHTMGEFLESLLFEGMSDKALLRYSQELLMVKRILDADDTDVLSSIGLARSVTQACRLVADYKLSNDPEYYLMTEETKKFHQWKQSLDLMKQKHSVVSAYDLNAIAVDLVKAGGVDLPKSIVCLGFLVVSPSEQELLDTFTAAGSTIVSRDMIAYNLDRVNCATFTNIQDEVLYCAKWAKEVIKGLKEGEAVSIVVPSIDDYRELINETFTAVIGGTGEDAWDVGGGLPLLSHPEAQTLMDILTLELHGNDIELIQRVFMAQSLSTGLSEHNKGRVLSRLRDKRKTTYDLADVLEVLKQFSKSDVGFEAVSTQFEDLNIILKASDEPLPLARWVPVFGKIGDTLGWMEDTDNAVLKERIASDVLLYRSMSRFTSNLNKPAAVAWLREHFQLLRFSYPRKTPSVIRVISYTDALGTFSKASWVLGLSSENMPGDIANNSFVPHSLQQSGGMPMANYDLFFAQATRNLEAILSSGRNVVCSYTTKNIKGVKQTPCRMLGLFADSDPLETSHLLSHDTVKVVLADDEDRLPAITPEQLKMLTGTASFLDDFKAAPFNASIKRRYKVRSIDDEIGISYSSQGQIMHAAMELIWAKMTSTTVLRKTSDKAIGALVDQAVLKSIESNNIIEDFGPVMASLECKQTTAIVLDYVMQIKNSDLVFEVLENEYRSSVEVSGLVFNLRLDQVLSTDGKPWVLDFKRSKSYKAQWMKKRVSPSSMQLPMYSAMCSYNGQKFQGIAISKVHQEDVSMASVGTFDALQNSCTQDEWAASNNAWSEVITGLVDKFASGNVHEEGTFFPDSFEKRISLLA